MGFDFYTIIAKSSIVLALIVIAASINISELESFVEGISISSPKMVKLMVNFILVVFVAGIFMVPSLNKNASKLINKPFDYANKLFDTFMK